MNPRFILLFLTGVGDIAIAVVTLALGMSTEKHNSYWRREGKNPWLFLAVIFGVHRRKLAQA
jgi:hypothetical protein